MGPKFANVVHSGLAFLLLDQLEGSTTARLAKGARVDAAASC